MDVYIFSIAQLEHLPVFHINSNISASVPLHIDIFHEENTFNICFFCFSLFPFGNVPVLDSSSSLKIKSEKFEREQGDATHVHCYETGILLH